MNDLEKERSRRLCYWMDGKPMPPLRISIFPTNRCNLNCLFCGGPEARRNGHFKFDKELSKEDWVRIVKEGVEMGILEWWVGGGGDPMARSDTTVAILNTIKDTDKNAECELTTNGTNFTPEIIDNLVKIGVDKIQLSLDGIDKKLHDFYRGVPGTFDKITTAIKTFIRLKKEYKTNKPKITINMVLNAKNVDRISEMVELAHKLGVNEIMITPMRIESGNKTRIEENGLRMDELQKKRIRSNFEKAKKLAVRYNIFIDLLVNEGQEEILEEEVLKRYKKDEIETPWDVKKNEHPFLALRCYELWYTMAIDAYGYAGSCVTAADGDPKYDVRKCTLHDLWYGEFFTRLRERLIQNKLLKVCSHCTVTDMRNKVRSQLANYRREVDHG